MSARTFKIESPHMTGGDIGEWQHSLNDQLARWGIPAQVKVDEIYGVGTRSLTSTVLHGLGIAQEAMERGVTPELRVKVRNRRLSVAERARHVSRGSWRAKLKRRLTSSVSSPLVKVLADSWGYHLGVHDGMDLICPPNAAIHSMTDGEVVRADTSGWWGKAPSGDVSKGDGIVIVRCSETVGPFHKGMNVCYGHAEHPRVKAGEKVRAGEHIATAGLAVAWHIHLMVNDNSDTRGVGDRDPRPFYNYARTHG